MENKKQLLIIPPMSGPLQKLNEVLDGIAVDENIEISIIDDLKELTQFIGSTGQCLIAFSNAKKCATFLQENRFVIAKTHTKVILLTPKEIPAKTLIKFTKIGLTESILENSPPKTLLYKVKLLLRSIKTSGGNEDKELAVKTMTDASPAQSQAKNEINMDRLLAEDSSVNYLAEERAKFKKSEQEDGEAINYGENLKGKTSSHEEAIDTHWKSKRKNDDSLSVEEEKNNSKLEEENSAEIDMYYRGKRKGNALDVIEGDEISIRKKLDYTPDEEDLVGKKIETTNLDLEQNEAENRKKIYDNEGFDYQLDRPKTSFIEEVAEEEKKRALVDQEDEEERKRKELMELDALFEEAKKRQEARDVEDLGGHYKGKVHNVEMDLEEPEATEERKEYDNSDLYSKEKSLDLELVPVSEDERRKMQNEDSNEERKRKGYGENINTDMASGDGSVDHIETMMKSDMGLDRSKNIKTQEIQEREKSKNQQNDEIEEKSKEKDQAIAAEENFNKKKESTNEIAAEEKSKSRDTTLAEEEVEDRKRERSFEEEENPFDRQAQTRLKLVESEQDDRQSEHEVENDSMSYKKIDTADSELDKKKNLATDAKVDKIDTYYRSGEAKKKDHDWDIDERKKSLDLGLQKSANRGPDNIQKKETSDLGEQTIDYRKIKEEFEAISRGEAIYDAENGSVGSAGTRTDDNEDGSFKVIEIDPAGFDFAINILNMIYQKELRPEDFYKTISEELQKSYHAYPVFYSYKPSDDKHIEAFDSIMKMPLDQSGEEIKNWWLEHKKDEIMLSEVFAKSMATWVCREMNWEDVELPAWAANELTNKKVELIYPYFDGVDRMGIALIYFPHGLNPKQARGIEVTLEMARTLLLDTIQRKTAPGPRTEEATEEGKITEKKNILNAFSGLFKGKKAG